MKAKALLAIDIGNSTIGFGLYPDATANKILAIEKLQLTRITSSAFTEHFISDFLLKHCRIPKPATRYISVAISSVAPKFNNAVSKAVQRFCAAPLIITPSTETGLSLDVKHPEKLGTDRIANALAGYTQVRKPVAVVDLGTATTITVVGRGARLLGGAIMPGIQTMIGSLACKTSLLPLVAPAKPRSALGKDTSSAIISGTVNGTAAAIIYIQSRIEKEIDTKLALILTGGHAALLSPLLSKKHLLIPSLIFEGIRLIHSKQN
ncbi:MAG TPA: type III pantothenate kinase [Dissulfurispiraceae bacterium]|nr:type III pantothenate kinase [Dissulfurispiraceae bacterium]